MIFFWFFSKFYNFFVFFYWFSVLITYYARSWRWLESSTRFVKDLKVSFVLFARIDDAKTKKTYLFSRRRYLVSQQGYLRQPVLSTLEKSLPAPGGSISLGRESFSRPSYKSETTSKKITWLLPPFCQPYWQLETERQFYRNIRSPCL